MPDQTMPPARVSDMRTRTSLLMLILSALLLGSVGSLVAVASTTGTADACSIAPPWAEVSPSTGLQRGQEIGVVGYNYLDLIFHDEQPRPAVGQPVAPSAGCDFDTIPMQNIEIVWHGDVVQRLGVASGPDFKLAVRVPDNAGRGEAWITVGGHEVPVRVGSISEPPPPPCPLTLGANGIAQHDCPEPWPCPEYYAGQTEPAPGRDVAPGFLPPCPEPCVDYAHTTGDGTATDYKWDCPDPCGYPRAAPGAGGDTSAIWCPPPDPCLGYPDGTNHQNEYRDICPDPCPIYAYAEDGRDAESSFYCPDPCGYDRPMPATAEGTSAIWCPPPEPCEVYPAAADRQVDPRVCPPPPYPCPLYSLADDGARPDIAIYCPDPEPCPVYSHAEGQARPEIAIDCPPPCPLYAAQDAPSLTWCPDPCGYGYPEVETNDAEAASYCPDPCRWVGVDARVCPEPCPVYLDGDTRRTEPDLPIYCPDPCGYDTQRPASQEGAVWCPPYYDDTTTSPPSEPARPADAAVEVVGAATPVSPPADAEAQFAADPDSVTAAAAPAAVAESEPNEPATPAETEAASNPVGPAELSPAIDTIDQQPAAFGARDIEPMARVASQRIARSVAAILAALFG